ncbi:HAMP domain-containing protein [Pseudomonas congelans]|uniref:HAMP domain-containing protein n=1 Tax=Pseudomonas congelans TaxID=200452 RepID=UPI003F5CF4ED
MLIVVLWLASVIIRNIKVAVVDVNRTLMALSTRDLTARTRYVGKDEFGEISRNLDNMAHQISEVISEIGSATAQVAPRRRAVFRCGVANQSERGATTPGH